MDTIRPKSVRDLVPLENQEFMNTLVGVFKDASDRNFPSEMIKRSRTLECPLLVMADSYKAGHYKMYPKAQKMFAYGECRKSMGLEMGLDTQRVLYTEIDETGAEKTKEKTEAVDDRIVVYGMRYIIEQIVSRVITEKDIKCAEDFYRTHYPGEQLYEFPREMFEKINALGHFPVKIEALPEGSVVLPHTPIFFITAEGDYSHFCTFLETILTMVWYPCCVATLSKHTKELIQKSFVANTEDGVNHILLNSRLHDFGFRGCTSI